MGEGEGGGGHKYPRTLRGGSRIFERGALLLEKC